MAAQPLLEAVSNEPSMHGEVLALKDILHVGPIKKAPGQSFSQLRTEFWKEVVNDEKQEIEVNDLEKLLEITTQLHNNPDAVVWLWMAPWPADVCAYYWMLNYMSKHLDRFYVLNLAGLPFLNEEGKVYYPKNISEILPKELVKARRLARAVTPAELEVDGEQRHDRRVLVGVPEERDRRRHVEHKGKPYRNRRSHRHRRSPKQVMGRQLEPSHHSRFPHCRQNLVRSTW